MLYWIMLIGRKKNLQSNTEGIMHPKIYNKLLKLLQSKDVVYYSTDTYTGGDKVDASTGELFL